MQSLRAPDVEAAIQIDPVAGRFSIARSNYTDPAIFRAEMEHIFSKCWLYVGHDVRSCRAQSVHNAATSADAASSSCVIATGLSDVS